MPYCPNPDDENEFRAEDCVADDALAPKSCALPYSSEARFGDWYNSAPVVQFRHSCTNAPLVGSIV
ncbi:MAG TPA: hypothetical protein VK558_16625 [Patescibacteria group bacterium]|nr:hypothetical protein [Patescibacteria group bacterium]